MNFIRIGSWSAPRMVGRVDGKVALQVRVPLCRTCGACEARSEYVKARLAVKGIAGEWSADEQVVMFESSAKTNAEKLAELIELLGLPVTLLGWRERDMG